MKLKELNIFKLMKDNRVNLLIGKHRESKADFLYLNIMPKKTIKQILKHYKNNEIEKITQTQKELDTGYEGLYFSNSYWIIVSESESN